MSSANVGIVERNPNDRSPLSKRSDPACYTIAIPTTLLSASAEYFEPSISLVSDSAVQIPDMKQMALFTAESHGDITKLEIDAIVNAANSTLLGKL